MDSQSKRSKFVDEVDELATLIEACGCWMINGDFEAVDDAFKNSLFLRYVQENKAFRDELRLRASENSDTARLFYSYFGVTETTGCEVE